MKHVASFLAILAFSGWAGTVNATLIGATVNQTFYFPDTSTLFCDNGNAVVGAGVEYAAGCGGFAPVVTDVTANQIFVDSGGLSWSPATFNGFVLSILSGIDFTSAVYDSGTMAATSVQVTDGDLWLNFEGQSGGIAVFNFVTTDAVVPAPTTLALIGLGLAGLGWSRRKKV